MSKHLTSPRASKEMPQGIPYIVGNEAAERFSYYGMKTILVVFMTKYLMDSSGAYDVMSAEDAKSWYHLFGTAVYFFPIVGSILADTVLGKYRTIMSLSVVYVLGHAALAIGDTGLGGNLMEPRTWLAVGLTLIAIGSGGIKPCVSAHVGDQFGQSNKHLLEKVFGWFYFSINLGAFASTLLTPVLLAKVGPSVAFGVPGVLMFLATVVFWMGRKVFVHIPPGGTAFIKETFSAEGLKAAGKLGALYAFVAMFWALFDQTGSAWVLQAENMDRRMIIDWLPEQIQAINPLLIMFFIPLFNGFKKPFGWVGIYPLINKFFPLTPLRKIGIGFFLTVPAFLLPGWIEMQIEAGHTPNIIWQLLSYVLITAAEVFVSITCLEFSYTQAPKNMKSFIMGLFLMSVSMGNLFTAVVNMAIQEEAVVAELSGESVNGERKVPLSGTTTYALSCQGALDAASTSVEAQVKQQLPKAAAVEGEKPAVKITRFGVGEAEGRMTIKAGESATLTWTSEGAQKCTLRPPGLDVAASGSKEVKPEKTTTYALGCEGPEGEVESEMQVAVTQDVRIEGFTINGQGGVTLPTAGEVTLAWKTSQASKCTITASTLKLSGPGYYFFFAGAMLITAVLFVFYAMVYKYKTYIQDEQPDGGGDGAGGASSARDDKADAA